MFVMAAGHSGHGGAVAIFVVGWADFSILPRKGEVAPKATEGADTEQMFRFPPPPTGKGQPPPPCGGGSKSTTTLA